MLTTASTRCDPGPGSRQQRERTDQQHQPRRIVGVRPVAGEHFGSARFLPALGAVSAAAANIDQDITRYPTAGHGFMNDRTRHELSISDRLIAMLVAAGNDEESCRDARRRIVAFFRKHLNGVRECPIS